MRLLQIVKNILKTEQYQSELKVLMEKTYGDVTGEDSHKVLTAKLLVQQLKNRGNLRNLQDAEFQVFSQFGDDGIIQYLINAIPITCQKFVEFGVQNYTESNTRFLLINDNWSGLVIDSEKHYIDFIINDSIYWRHDLTCVHSFIDKDNINSILKHAGFYGELGILSIDIDGNDYWIWDSINVVDPIMVVIEYNSVFGKKHAITVPYDSKFNRTTAHWSNLYFGASLKALSLLGEKKGYTLVASNSSGNNAYFVRKDMIGKIVPVTAESAYVESKFRESRDEQGNLTYLSGDSRIKAIEELPVIDIERGHRVKIRELDA